MLRPRKSASLLFAAWRDLEQRKVSIPLLKDRHVPVLLQALTKPDELSHLESHPMTWKGGVDIVATRTRLLDTWLERPSWPPLRTTRRQTVLLGAGLDSRPYRLGFSRYVQTVFEVDADEAMLQAKHAALQAAGYEPRCGVKLVGADVRDMGAIESGLIASGFDPRLPTRWVAEGILEQLPATSHAGLFALCQRLGGVAGSGIAAQALEPAFGAHARAVLAEAGGASAAEFPFEPDALVPRDETLGLLQTAGWTSVRGLGPTDIAEVTGRQPPEGYNLVFGDADPLTAE